MSALVCLQVRALGVDLAAPVELTPVDPPPAVGRRVPPAHQSRLVAALGRAAATAAAPDFAGQVRRHPAAGGRAGLRRGRRRADDGGAKRSGGSHQDAQRVGGEAVGGRELLGTVRRLAAGVRVHAVTVQDGAVLIVVLQRRRRRLRVRLGLGGLVAARQDQLAPQVLRPSELEVRRGDVRLALQVALQLQAGLSVRGGGDGVSEQPGGRGGRRRGKRKKRRGLRRRR